MKYVSIVRLAPGVDNVKRAFEVFSKHGMTDATEALYAGIDGKTFITIADTDDPEDMVNTSTYAPFFESSMFIPVVDVDEAWTTAIVQAIANMSE
jgi:nitrogen regulatory protein PII-like uncharacterized protein